MRRIVVGMVVCVALLGSTRSEAVPIDPKIKEGLEGVWQGELMINNAPFAGATGGLAFRRNKVTRMAMLAIIGGQLGVNDESEEGTFRTEGKSIDLEFRIGKMAAIYEVDGNTARLAYFLKRGSPRPTDFTTLRDGELLIIHKLKRVLPITNSIGMKLAVIPPGEFLMGTPDTDKDARDNEKPQHGVRITRFFYMGVHEVTQQEYERVMGNNPSFFSQNDSGKRRVEGLNTERFPVEQVSWDDAMTFCKKLSDLPEEKKAGRVYHLPTEAEWEYACRAGRAGKTTSFSHGDALSSRQANFDGSPEGPSLARPAMVGSYPHNPFGLHDMHGNVSEWCLDSPRKYTAEGVEDPNEMNDAGTRMVRGGSWSNPDKACRSAARSARGTSVRSSEVGFRVICR